MRILFLTPRFPYPPLRGDQVRAYHQIRLLGQRHAVTVVALSERQVEPGAEAHVRAMCDAVHIEPLSWERRLTGLGRMLTGDPRPAQTLLYSTAGQSTVTRLIASGRFDVVHAQLLRTAGFLPPALRTPVVIDLVDTLSASYARRRAIAPVWLRPALAFERRRLLRYEHRLLRSNARCLVVSEAERHALGGPGTRAVVNPNGVDTTAFPFTPGQGRAHRIVFVGNLGYAPNTDAALWFANDVFPRIRAQVPQSEFMVVGPRAPRRIRDLAARPGITLAGCVPDVHQSLATAQVAVAPLRAGAGIQNKVLEAMAAGIPVVATSRAVSGVDVAAHTHCLVADDPGHFAEAVTTLLGDADLRGALAHAAHDLISARYTWDRTVGDLEVLYRELVRAAGESPGPRTPPDGLGPTTAARSTQPTRPTHSPAPGTNGTNRSPTGRP